MRMLDGIDEDTVDFNDNYSGDDDEPDVLPARFPNLLVNGSQGIAVGMATNIPPHNLGEVIDATVHLIDNPEATPDDLMQFVQGPDFPTGALIMGRQGIIDAYRTGKGSIRLRAVCEIEEASGRGGDQIVVTEMPYQTSISVTAARIAELVQTRADRRHQRRQRRVGPGQDPPRHQAEEGRARPRHPQQPLQAHAAADELRGEHGGARRRRPAHAQPRAGAAGLRRPPGRGHPPPLRVPPREGAGPGPHRRGPAQGRRRHRRRSSPSSGPPTTAPPPASGSWRRRSSSPRCRPSTSSTCSSASSPAWPGSTSRPRWPSCRETIAELEAILGDEARAAHRHQGRAGRGQGEVRRRAALQDHLRRRRHEHRGPHRRRGARRHAVGQGLHQDGRRPTRSGPRAAAAAAWPGPSCATRTTSPTSSPPPPTPTCCSSRTSGASTGSRPTRSRRRSAPRAARRCRTCCSCSPTSTSRRSSTRATTRRTASCSSPPRRAR